MTYDLAVIGAGWAGFNASIAAHKAGLKVCLIDKALVGGACLNRGCIPTKALIQSARVFALVKKSHTFGIEVTGPRMNFAKAQERKEKIVSQLGAGMLSMLKGIDFFNSQAEFVSNTELKLSDQKITAKNILVSCGSRPIELDCMKFDRKKVISSDEILDLKEVPASLLIIGGGVIGCEFASLFSCLGTEVTIVEKLPQLLPGEDADLAKKIESVFRKKGVKINTNSDASSFKPDDFGLTLVCVGRAPNTAGLGLEKIGVKLDKKGAVLADEYLKTCVANVYSAGDATASIMLAHFAAYQGIIAAHNIAHPENPKKADNRIIPNCIFTDPEIASVGLNQEKAEKLGLETTVHRFDLLGSGMARILDEADGFIKITCDKNTEELLGGSIVGPKATELIGILTLAVSCQLKLPQARNIIFAHPTLSESIHEAFK